MYRLLGEKQPFAAIKRTGKSISGYIHPELESRQGIFLIAFQECGILQLWKNRLRPRRRLKPYSGRVTAIRK
jgi:hypothetical protein